MNQRAKKTAQSPTDRIAWTEERRAEVYASRRVKSPEYFRNALVSIGTEPANHPLVAEHWYQKVLYYYRSKKRELERGKRGVVHAPDAWRAASKAAIALCSKPSKSMSKTALSSDVEAALVTLELCPVFSALPYWLAREDVSFALKTLVRCHSLVCSTQIHGYTSPQGAYIVETTDYASRRPEYADSAWHVLRGAIAEASTKDYKKARAMAAQLRKDAPLPARALLAFAFPAESAWAKEAVADMLPIIARTKKCYSVYLARLCAVATPEDAMLLVTTPNGALSQRDLLTILAHHGEAGAKVVEAAMRGATNQQMRKTYAEVLLMVETEEAGELFSGWTENRVVAPILLEHRERMAASNGASAKKAVKKKAVKKKAVKKKSG